MDSWLDICRKARAFHAEALARAGGDRRAKTLIAAALAIDDLEVERYEPGSIVNESVLGFLERASRLINIAAHQGTEAEAVVVAHEIGHFKLYEDPRNEVTARSHLLGGDPIESGGEGRGVPPARGRKSRPMCSPASSCALRTGSARSTRTEGSGLPRSPRSWDCPRTW